MVIAPDKKVLVMVSAGFNDTGVSLLDFTRRRSNNLFRCRKFGMDLAFSRDGHRIFVSGGDSGKIYVFNYKIETATALETLEPSSGRPTTRTSSWRGLR